MHRRQAVTIRPAPRPPNAASQLRPPTFLSRKRRLPRGSSVPLGDARIQATRSSERVIEAVFEVPRMRKCRGNRLIRLCKVGGREGEYKTKQFASFLLLAKSIAGLFFPPRFPRCRRRRRRQRRPRSIHTSRRSRNVMEMRFIPPVLVRQLGRRRRLLFVPRMASSLVAQPWSGNSPISLSRLVFGLSFFLGGREDLDQWPSYVEIDVNRSA